MTMVSLFHRRRPDGKDAAAEDGVHVTTAAGAGEAVQAEQVSVAAEAVRSGHVAHAHGDAGQQEAVVKML